MKQLAAILFLLLSPIAAQSATPIPLEGQWEVDGKTNPRFWKTMKDQTGMRFRVNECGNKITMFNRALIGGNMTLEFDGTEYAGQGQWQNSGTGTIKANLKPVNEKLLKGKMFMIMSAAPTQEWDMTVRYEGAADTPDPGQGSASVFLTKDSEWQLAGLFREREREWMLRLTGFHPNSSLVLENHAAAIQDIKNDESDLPIVRPDEQPRLCESYAHEFGEVEGFADTGIEKDNAGLPRDRADAVVDVLRYHWPSQPLVGRSGGAWNNGTGSTGAGVEPLPDASCPRAAIAPYKSKREYVYAYTREDADKWLRQWLGDLKAAEDPDAPLWTRQTDRTTAKARWCLAQSLLDMLEDGQCEVPTRFDADGTVAADQTIEHYALKGVATGTKDNVRYAYAQRPSLPGKEDRAGQVDGNIIQAWNIMDERSKRSATAGAMTATVREAEDAEANLQRNLDNIAPSSGYVYTCGRSDAETVRRREHADAIENEIFDQTLATPWDPLHADPIKGEYTDPDDEALYDHVKGRQ